MNGELWIMDQLRSQTARVSGIMFTGFCHYKKSVKPIEDLSMERRAFLRILKIRKKTNKKFLKIEF